jgi:hypothetical protein
LAGSLPKHRLRVAHRMLTKHMGIAQIAVLRQGKVVWTARAD